MIQKGKKSLMTKAAVILLILILPFNIIGVVVSLISYQNSVKNTEVILSHTLDSSALLLNNKIYNTNSALYELSNNNATLMSMRFSKNESEYSILRYQLYTSLTSSVRTSDIAELFFLYLVDADDYIQIPGFTGATVGTRPHFSYIEDYENSRANWFLSEDKSQLIRVLYDSSLNLYLGAAIDLTKFLSDLGGVKGFDSFVYSFGETELDSSASQLSFNTEICSGVYLTATVSSKDINNSIGLAQYAMILFFILYLALIPFLFHLMRCNVGDPLKKLNHAHAELQVGNEDYRISEQPGSLEFSTAYESFNQMASSLQELQKEVLDKELANKQLQIDFLQLQIRPHFLLNAFNVLYTLIQRGKKAPSQEMILFLSDYFRYLFRSGSELQLFSKERKLIEDYMNITKIYYPVSFEVSYQLDPLLDFMRVPPLLLHSFMENIIAHALLPDRQVHIVFSGEYNDGIVTFYIADDGKGIDPDSLYSINHVSDKPTTDGKNVGIKNSILRLKYYYGDEASVECDSELNVGTTFTITIPYTLEEE